MKKEFSDKKGFSQVWTHHEVGVFFSKMLFPRNAPEEFLRCPAPLPSNSGPFRHHSGPKSFKPKSIRKCIYIYIYTTSLVELWRIWGPMLGLWVMCCRLFVPVVQVQEQSNQVRIKAAYKTVALRGSHLLRQVQIG